MPQITKIVTQAKNPNRVNIFVDDLFLVGLDKFVWMQHRLKTGDEITPKLAEQLKQQSLDSKAYDKALKLLSFRPQSTLEIYQKLKARFEEEVITQTVAQLKQEGWLDDQRFAEQWVGERLRTRSRSINQLKAELIQKGIASTTIKEVLQNPELADQELATAQKLVERYRSTKTPLQLKTYLSRKGFSYSVIQKAIKSTNS